MPMTTVTRTYIINKIIRDNNLNSYLEIGVSNPYTNFLNIVCGKKVSVDPCIECEYFTREAIEEFKPFITYEMTSDDFFAQNAESFDLVFIDGDHSYEQSLKDLNNALKVVPVGGFVVLHDACPLNFESTQIENFKNKLPYNGEVWKTVVSAIRDSNGALKIGTFTYDWGVCVIKKLSENVPEISVQKLNYEKDYEIAFINPEYDLRVFYDPKVSYFTSLFNTPQKSIERTTQTVLNQTNPNWEWVLVDDSNNIVDAARLEKYFTLLNDPRIKYFRMNKQSGGFIGEAKKRAANLCTGDYLAELDHDDLLMPHLTDYILKNSEGFDFIYSNCALVRILDSNDFAPVEKFPEGFAMGYGSYRETSAVNPLTGRPNIYEECICVPINPKTIRHIVGVPNHIRVFAKRFYDAIGAHNPDLWVVDDYEIVLRAFLAGGKFLHLDTLGYLQVMTGDNTTDKRIEEIQIIVRAIMSANNEKIKQEFEMRNMHDWAYEYHKSNFGFQTFKYPFVPSIADAPAANFKI